MSRLRLIKIVSTAFACLTLAACTSDELTQDLPEGAYPLQIASVSLTAETNGQPWGANAPQSRVTENDERTSSVWQDGDKIKVQIGDGTPGTYAYQSGNMTVAGGDSPAYWVSKANGQTIRAWYTSSGNETVDLSNQTKGLAYVVTAQTAANFNEQVTLAFSHALAKVRVELTGEIASFVDNVSIKSYTTCTFTQGMLTSNKNNDEIKMYKVADKMFEANVYPGYQINDVKANNGTWTALTTFVTPEAAKIHKIEIEVKGGTTIHLSDQTEDIYTVESGKFLIIDGGGSSLKKRIVIKENAKVMLKNVILAAPADDNNTIEIQGTAMLLLSGINEITGTNNRCPLAVIDGTLTINGTNNDRLKLTGNNSNYAGCLGLRDGASLIINGGYIVANTQAGSGIGSYYTGLSSNRCGSITINGGIITASGGVNSAGIGSGSECECGDIIIRGGSITVIGGSGIGINGAAGIGSGYRGRCGNITISGKNTVVTATASSASSSDKIGAGESGNCGTVTIKAGATVNNTTYSEDHVGRI